MFVGCSDELEVGSCSVGIVVLGIWTVDGLGSNTGDKVGDTIDICYIFTRGSVATGWNDVLASTTVEEVGDTIV